MKPLVLSSTLSALRKAGSVFGVIFTRENEVQFTDAPFTPQRIEEIVATLDDIAFYFQKQERTIEKMSFGYDGGNLTIVMDGLLRLVVLHSNADEVDFVARAGRAFLKDFQMSQFARHMGAGNMFERAREKMEANEPAQPTPEEIAEQAALRPATQRVAVKAEQAVDPTSPITPQPRIAEAPAPAPEENPAPVPAPPPLVTPPAVAEQRTEEEAISGAPEVRKSVPATAPVLAAVQPESTLPPPRVPVSRRDP